MDAIRVNLNKEYTQWDSRWYLGLVYNTPDEGEMMARFSKTFMAPGEKYYNELQARWNKHDKKEKNS